MKLALQPAVMQALQHYYIINKMWGSKKPKQKVYSGFIGDCSQQQLVELNKFRAFVTTLHGSDNPEWTDIYLLRFLRARKFDQALTQKMWVEFIQWRKKNHIDTILYQFKFPEIPKLRQKYPHGYHKVDKQYRPIYIERVGFLNPEEIFSFTSLENLLQYHALSYENLWKNILPACTQLKKKQTGDPTPVQQTITILDLKDVALSKATKTYDFIKPASQMAQDNYPEILGNMFIINAPMLFTAIWAIVKMWIDDKTKQKIKILGGSYEKQLLQYINPENLPNFIKGGQCNCGGKDCLSHNIGPWNPQGLEMYPYAVGLKQYKEEIQTIIEKKQQSNIISKPMS